MQSPKVGLQFPAGQLYLQQQGQVAKDKGVQRGGAEAEREGYDEGGRLWQRGWRWRQEDVALGGGSGQQGPLG